MIKNLDVLQTLEESFTKAFLFSFGMHVLLVVLFIFVTHFVPSSLRINSKVYQVDLVSMPPKKSMSAAPPKPTISDKLPQATIEQMHQAQPEKPKTTDMTVPGKKVEPEKKVPEVDSKKLNQEIARIKHEVELEKRIAAIAAHAKETRPGEADGKAESAGSTEGTESGVVEGYQLAQYQDKVRVQILQAWNLPKWTIDSLPRGTYAILIVYIAKDGNVVRTEFEKSSGIQHFDESAVRAIKRASPLPPPPQELTAEAERKGLAVRFSPQKFGS